MGRGSFFPLQIVPQLMQFKFSVLMLESSPPSGLSLGQRGLRKPRALGRPHWPGCWWAVLGLAAQTLTKGTDGLWSVCPVSRLRLSSGKGWRPGLVSFITRTCKVKTQTKYLRHSTLRTFPVASGVSREHGRRGAGRLSRTAGLVLTTVHASWTPYWTVVE